MKITKKFVVVLVCLFVLLLTGCDAFMRVMIPRHWYNAFADQMNALDFDSMSSEFYLMQTAERELFYDDITNHNSNEHALYDYNNNIVDYVRFSTEFEKNRFYIEVPMDYFSYCGIEQTPAGWKLYYNGDEMPRRFEPATNARFIPKAPTDTKNCKLVVSRPNGSYISFVFNTESDARAFYDSYYPELDEQFKKDVPDNTIDDIGCSHPILKYRTYISGPSWGATYCNLYLMNMYGKYVVQLDLKF